MTRDNETHLFTDTNVAIDAFVFQHGDDTPMQLDTGNLTFVGTPAGLLLTMIGNQELVNGKRLVLHTSERSLKDMAAKLTSNYGWTEPATKQAMIKMIQLMKASGGTICRIGEAINIRTDERVTDREDQHRLAEARKCGADIFVSRDGDVLDLGVTHPVVMTPRQFLDRSRRR